MNMNITIPNSYLWQATTSTGGTVQVMVPFGEDAAPIQAAAVHDGETLDGPWQNRGVVYASTVRALVESDMPRAATA